MRRLTILMCALCLTAGLRADTDQDPKGLALDALKDNTTAARLCVQYCAGDATLRDCLKAISAANQANKEFHESIPRMTTTTRWCTLNSLDCLFTSACAQAALIVQAQDDGETSVRDAAMDTALSVIKAALRQTKTLE